MEKYGMGIQIGIWKVYYNGYLRACAVVNRAHKENDEKLSKMMAEIPDDQFFECG